MIKSLVRTFRGPSRDPRMAYISRPLPRGLPDEQVVEALGRALDANPDPRWLVETLPAALREVTGHDYQVLDRSVRDVTGAFSRTSVMIRDGSVGLWPGYEARAYPMLATGEQAEEARREIAAAAGEPTEPSPTNPAGKPGWAPPPPATSRRGAAVGAAAFGPAAPDAAALTNPVGDANAGASLVQDAGDGREL